MDRVTMPQLGETVVEGTIVRWLKREGDDIAPDESLFEVSTDKVDTEVPSAFGGVVRKLLVAEGDTVEVGVTVALIGLTADEPLPADEPVPATAPTPTARPIDEAATLSSSGPVAAPAAHRDDAGAFLSPVVRRLLDEHHLDPARIVGSGAEGRITRADVLAVAANSTRDSPHDSPAGAHGVPGPTPVAGIEPGPTDTVVPFTKARRTTAEHLTRSLATAAHALVVTEVDYARVEPVRVEAGLSYLPFVARAVVAGLAGFPHLNASVGDDCLVVHGRLHLGIAVDLAHDGLIVPVLRDAELLRLPAIARAVADLADRARRHRLSPGELEGATFTLTNVGSFGTVVAAPIINQPQVAILSTDGIRMRPVARAEPDGGWSVAIHPVGNLSLSFDHRALDGAYAAGFLAHVRDVLEHTDWTAEVGS